MWSTFGDGDNDKAEDKSNKSETEDDWADFAAADTPNPTTSAVR